MATVYARPAVGTALPNRHPRQGASNHQPLNLTRTLKDRVDRSIPMHGLRSITV